ncbi:MAG: metal-dependent hydrolase [Candidatus Pacearchaeota archaeon]
MFTKTHILLGLFVALYFLPYSNNKAIFFPVVLIASVIPDIDIILLSKKEYNLLRFFKSQTYKNFMHSYTLCIFISVLLAFYYPLFAFPFFLGYSFHLFFDSLTTLGTNPFWPLKVKSQGPIVPGGKAEELINWVLITLNAFFAFKYLFYAN